ncbi:MAG TPA: sulfatase [Thermoanaerobaculia bacterium]|jgi:arylsulfatase A-like enzyme|nr:sulfatase [Thermoanaerobaculia bacterium]
MRRAILFLVLLLPLLAACEKAPRARQTRERRRLAGEAKGWNVVLLTVDTLRADRLGAYGYRANSPRIDAQLASGVLFEQAMSQRASTWPSLASLLTGLYPSGHGVAENGYGFPDGLPTLPKLLHGAGYQTGAFLSNMCDANHQGWDDFACAGGQDGKSVRRALEWMRKVDGQRPFFLWVHLFGAHPPYYNGGDLAKELDPGYTGTLGPKKWQLDPVMTKPIPLSARDVRHLDALYDAAVTGSDRLSASLLDGLEAAGRLERTVVLFAADHGEELYQHNRYLYHSCSVYQTALHVPLGFSAPGLLPAGARVPQTVELIDVLPTLLDLLGIAKPAEQHGRSLVPYLERVIAGIAGGAGGAGKPAFSEYGSSTVRTVVQGNWKLVHNPDGFSPVCIPDAPPGHYPIGREELYDLSKDPGEKANLAAAQPARVAELAKLIRQRFAGVKNRTHQQEMSDELKKKLNELGYVAH